VGRRDGKALLR